MPRECRHPVEYQQFFHNDAYVWCMDCGAIAAVGGELVLDQQGSQTRVNTWLPPLRESVPETTRERPEVYEPSDPDLPTSFERLAGVEPRPRPVPPPEPPQNAPEPLDVVNLPQLYEDVSMGTAVGLQQCPECGEGGSHQHEHDVRLVPGLVEVCCPDLPPGHVMVLTEPEPVSRIPDVEDAHFPLRGWNAALANAVSDLVQAEDPRPRCPRCRTGRLSPAPELRDPQVLARVEGVNLSYRESIVGVSRCDSCNAVHVSLEMT